MVLFINCSFWVLCCWKFHDCWYHFFVTRFLIFFGQTWWFQLCAPVITNYLAFFPVFIRDGARCPILLIGWQHLWTETTPSKKVNETEDSKAGIETLSITKEEEKVINPVTDKSDPPSSPKVKKQNKLKLKKEL